MPSRPKIPAAIKTNASLVPIWKSTVKRLEALGLLSAVDTTLIERYVRLQWRHAHQEAELDKLVAKSYLSPLVTESAAPLVHWLEKTVASSAERLTRMERELGLTPTGRAQIGRLDQLETEANTPGLSLFEGTG